MHSNYIVNYTYNLNFFIERDKFLITRTAVFELVQALKFKTIIPDTNFLMLANLVLQVIKINYYVIILYFNHVLIFVNLVL